VEYRAQIAATDVMVDFLGVTYQVVGPLDPCTAVIIAPQAAVAERPSPSPTGPDPFGGVSPDDYTAPGLASNISFLSDGQLLYTIGGHHWIRMLDGMSSLNNSEVPADRQYIHAVPRPIAHC
jgi:hypothetical protein